jgi:hypothetical protein
MSNQLTVPAHIAARIAARQQSGTKSSVAAAIVSDGLSIPRISIRAGRYRLVEGGVETPVGINLDVVIIGANPRVSKVFYAGEYDPNAEATPPACYSNDGVAPDPSVDKPVCSNCAACPHNVLGSKILKSGAKSKTCADQRHLAVVAAADPSKVYSLTVPVSGMKALREYFKELGNYGIGPEEVITELGFDDTASFPKIIFRQKGFVPEKVLGSVDELVASDDAKIATRQMAPKGAPALAAPPAHAAIAAPVAPAAPVVDDAYEEEEADAPVATQPAAAPQPAPKPTVAPVTASSELAAKIDSLFEE